MPPADFDFCSPSPDARACRRAGRCAGFTLIELLVASLIAAGIAGATLAALSRAVRARDASESRQSALSAAGFAADRIALDVQNLVYAGDLYDARVLLVDQGNAGDLSSQRDELLVFVHQSRQVRPAADQNEGGAYEVQYRLQNPVEPAAMGYVLWRRADPVPDQTPDGGGVASPVVAGIAALSIDAFDGESWLSSWDSDRDGYPHALRITTMARTIDRGTGRPVELWARRTIAIDRPPQPYATPQAASGGAS